MDSENLSPFTAGKDNATACLNFLDNMSHGYIEGYRRAAEVLCLHVEKTNRDHDYLVYPACDLYRHYLELQFKEIIRMSRQLLGEEAKYPYTHELSELWDLSKKLLRRVDPHLDDPEEFKKLDELIQEFASIDLSAQDFRFAIKTKGDKSLDGIKHISLKTLRETVEPLAHFLSACEMRVTYSPLPGSAHEA